MNGKWSVVTRVPLLVTVLLGLAGCYQEPPPPRVTGVCRPLVIPPAPSLPPAPAPALTTPAPPPAPMTAPVRSSRRLIGRSVQGRPILVQITGHGTDTVLIMGSIHGDEPAGARLVNRLAEHLQDSPQLLTDRRVVLLPVTNPDGLAARTRANARGIDLNRNFETGNRVDNRTNGLRSLTEPESQALQSLIKEYAPSRIVSIHSPLNCIDYDGPGQAIAARMAQECDLAVKKLGARPGSLGSYTGATLGIPTITLELPSEAGKMTDLALWEKYGQALMAAVLYPDRAP